MWFVWISLWRKKRKSNYILGRTWKKCMWFVRIYLTKTHEITLHIEEKHEEYYCDSCEFVLQKPIKSNYTLRVSKEVTLITWLWLCSDCLCVLRISFYYEKKLHASHGYFLPSGTDCLCFRRLPFCVARKSHTLPIQYILMGGLMYLWTMLYKPITELVK